MKSELLAARVHPWQAFKLRKLAEETNQHMGLLLTEVIKSYFSSIDLPPGWVERWLDEYHKLPQSGEGQAEIDEMV